eukprot:TRINITY_DN63028_c0_g1_i1.p4 TRINITY_DN63028_c0_g1~~TRINITY_DN63028_c0_g1_i1.p4  ORF type:complete len:118 (-),score=29.74 TRINITY_DN63028_c0_g1_i1:78-386(-)
MLVGGASAGGGSAGASRPPSLRGANGGSGVVRSASLSALPGVRGPSPLAAPEEHSALLWGRRGVPAGCEAPAPLGLRWKAHPGSSASATPSSRGAADADIEL